LQHSNRSENPVWESIRLITTGLDFKLFFYQLAHGGGGVENGEEMSFGDGSGVLDDTDDYFWLG
jgi:hypothetical protein